MKIQLNNPKTTQTYMVSLPKKLIEALGWKKGDTVKAELGKQRSILLKRVNEPNDQKI